MRRPNGFRAAMLVVLFSAVLLTMASAIFDGKSTAQPVEPGSKSAPAGQQMRPPAPVVDVRGLMRLFNKPLYMGLKENMARQPASEDEWNDLLARGLQAAEIANLVAIRKVEGPKEPVLQGASELQRAGVAFAAAAEAQQWDATRRAYLNLVQKCNNCHQAIAPDHAPRLEP